jgi:hypothetical protein
MTDNIISGINSDSLSISDSDAANTSLQQAAAALVQYVQTVTATPNGTTESDNTNVLHEMATTFMQETAAAIATTAATISSPPPNTSDMSGSTLTGPIPENLTQATSSFVEHLGDLLINPQASDTDPAALMKDVQEIWKNKSPTDTVTSTAASIWQSIQSSQHLPVIAGMLASVIFKKK